MAELITMPKLSDTMEEGGISEWLKKEGETITSGEPLVAIETDKATIEYPSPEDGTLLKILVQPGGAVPIQAPIAVIGKKGEDFSSLLAQKSSGKKPTPASTSAELKKAAPEAHKPQPASSLAEATTSGRIKASPLARKVAQARGLDLRTIKGSGPAGRVVLQDVEKAQSRVALSHAPAGTSLEERTIPLSMMRKTIAKRLVQGKNEAPHFYLKVSANMENLLQWRTKLNEASGVREGKLPKVSINDLLMYLTARALLKHPVVNSSWQGDSILQHGQVHVAMAVALPQGLVTPVLPNTDHLGIRDIAALSKTLVQKARDGQLAPEDYTTGTFTISNLGMTVVEDFTAIINPPQAAILAVGAITNQVVVDDAGNFKAQKRLALTLSCDHRVVDGMAGAQFLETLVSYLEHPYLLLA